MLIHEQEYSTRNCTQHFGMLSGLNPSRPLQGKIRTSFMNKDVSASSALSVFNMYLLQRPLFIVPLRPRVVRVGLMGDWEVEPPLPIVGKIYHLTPAENFVQEMNS